MKQPKKLYILRALFLFILLIGVYGSGNAQTKNSQNLSSDEYFRLAKIEANQKGNYPLAVSYCKKSLQKSPDNMDVHLLLGKCYLEIENYDSARYELKKVADAYPHSVDSRHYLINVEYKTGRYSSAICYINELLEVRPYSRTLWLKKVSIYNDMGNTVEAKRALTRLFSIYPTDTMVKNAYQELILNEAARYYKNGNFTKSSELLTKALEANPRDLLTLHQQVNNFLSAGKRSDAMGLIESGLSNFPGDPILIEKKIGVLQEMGNYQDALAFTQATMKKYPSAKLRTLANDLQLQAAEFYMNNDPYVLYQKIYATNPGNEEAFTYLLNNSLTKGYYSDAEEYIKIALKRSPNNKVVLMKQLTLFELEHKTAEANKAIEKLVTMFPSDGELQDKYSTILLAQAKGYFQDQLYTQAQPLFEKLMRFPDMISTANDYLYSIQLAQKNYSAALILINKQIARYPRDENYVFKKASLLEEMGKYDDAIEITNRLTKKNPTNSLYKQSFISQSIPYIKQLMEDEKYDSAMIVIDRLLENDPTNLLAYNYAINVQSIIKDYKNGLEYCDQALRYYPDSREIKLKKASLFSSLNDYDQSVGTFTELESQYPYNGKIKTALAEELARVAKNYERANNQDSAIYYYAKAYNVSPLDTFSLYRMINIQLTNKNYDLASALIDSGLVKYPDNSYLYYKKGVLLEMQEKYDSAAIFLKKGEPQYGDSPNYLNYLDYLLGKSYKHQAGISFIRTYYDSSVLRSSIASFEYTTYKPKNTYTYHFNYAARPIGTGVQHEMDWIHKYENKRYRLVNVAVANKFVFPYFKLGVSFYKKTKKYDMQRELGLRYVLQKDKNSLVSVVGGLEKEWNDVWVNARAFVMTDFSNLYQTITLQSRYYFNLRNDYIMAMGSLGTPPEDKTLDFQVNTFLQYVTRMVGGGYQHAIKHRTTIGIQGNWYNFKIEKTNFVNQYNLFITLLTKF